MSLYFGRQRLDPESIGGRIAGVLMGLTMLFLGLMVWVLAYPGLPLLVVFMGVPFPIVGLVTLVRALRRSPVARTFEQFDVVLPPGALLESTVTGSVSLVPKKPLEVVGATVSLAVEESMLVRRQRGMRIDVDDWVLDPVTETVHTQAQSLAVPAALSAPFNLAFELKLPPNVPPTLWGEQGSVKTQIEVTIDVKNQPSVSVKRELIVRAERAR